MKNAKENLHDIAEQYLLEIIKSEHPEWVEDDGSCSRCEEYYNHLDDLIELD